jgi:membrane protein implicated in regulation of membrane protease activity
MHLSVAMLCVFGAYLAVGLLFAIPFVLVGAGRIDPHAAHGSWGFRVLILPGAALLWPLLARRWLNGVHEPPEENNPHRCAARKEART